MTLEFAVLCIGALITGISKFSVGGLGILIAPVLLYAFPASTVLGVLLPMYLITDLMVVACYRDKIAWGVLLKIIPAQVVGLLIATLLIANLNADFLPKLIALMILMMIVFGCWLDYYEGSFMKNGAAITGAGTVSGFAALAANAGGPFITLILMEQRLAKETYTCTRAWNFFLVDILKIPVLLSMGFLNQETLMLSTQALPALMLGGVIGFTILKKIDMRHLKWVIRGISSVAALKLLMA
ncbi:MAG: sulfite exporter TauE/SafE family protein [Neptuniibacter sp.]